MKIGLLKKIFGKNLTILRGKPDFSKSREVTTLPIREVEKERELKFAKTKKPVVESLACPYCFSTNFVRRGWRKKKHEKVQLYLCKACGKTFTPHLAKGKHYPLAVILEALSLYNLGYSLETVCRILNRRHSEFSSESILKQVQDDSLLNQDDSLLNQDDSLLNQDDSLLNQDDSLLNQDDSLLNIQASSVANWINEFAEHCPFLRMRYFALKKYSPEEMVAYATLAHQQLFRYRFHRAKCELVIKDDYRNRRFWSLKEFLEMVPSECPHQYFLKGLRASEAPMTFSKKQMIVRSKQNFANQLCEFVLQSVKERKKRHDALQRFMLYNDSVTVATEVPVYLTKDDLEHLRTQLGFEMYYKENSKSETLSSKQKLNSKSQALNKKSLEFRNSLSEGNSRSEHLSRASNLEFSALPKLITGHIDILQIRNGQIHILDYKPKAEKERPIEQLTLYAMALSRLTGLRLFEFKCAWFDENDYFEFYPLHVLHKPKRKRRRKKIKTEEGLYLINQLKEKIERLRPI